MFKKVILGVLIGVLFIGQHSLDLIAADSEMDKGYEFNLNYAEPSTGDHQGYICLFTRDSNGAYGIFTYFWNTIGTANTGNDSPTYAYLTVNSNSFKFQVAGGSNTSGFYSLTQIDNAGYWWNVKNSASESWQTDFGGGRTVLGFHYKGNVGTVSGMTMSVEPFTVYFNSDASATLLRDVWDLIHATYYQNAEIINQLESLYTLQSGRFDAVVNWLNTLDTKLDRIDAKLQTLIERANESLDLDRKRNTFLEKILDFLERSKEEEKQEATTQGNSSTSEGQNAIENKGQGFADSLASLTNFAAHTGVECKWRFPRVSIPAINGITDEIVLINAQDIDFTSWFNQIPRSITFVIQNLCTICLIVYCFKELYSIIEYVLTMNKGGSSD